MTAAGAPEAAIATKLTDVRPTAVALAVWTPAVGPNVHDVVAVPLTSVRTLAALTLPPPPVTANVTTALSTGLPALFLTTTVSGVTTVEPTVAWIVSVGVPVMVAGVTSILGSVDPQAAANASAAIDGRRMRFGTVCDLTACDAIGRSPLDDPDPGSPPTASPADSDRVPGTN